MKSKNIFLIISLLPLFFVGCSFDNQDINQNKNIKVVDLSNVNLNINKNINNNLNINQPLEIKDIYNEIPFASQAPFFEWDDDRFQDGCEEASSTIAMWWANNKIILSNQEMKDSIINISQYELDNFGYYNDMSISDVGNNIIEKYFNYNNYEIQEDVNLDNIKQALMAGGLVIVPTDGQRLNNPHYTLPGPERHMLVIIGYDPINKEFITNDPGTKYGKDYRYNEDVLYNAIQDYPSGDHLPLETENQKNILIFYK